MSLRSSTLPCLRVLVTSLMLLMATPVVSFAQDGQPAAEAPATEKPETYKKPTAEPLDNAMGFQATSEPTKENLPGWPFLYGAYAVIWALMLSYIIFLWRTQSKLDTRVASLDRKLDELDKKLDELDAGATS